MNPLYILPIVAAAYVAASDAAQHDPIAKPEKETIPETDPASGRVWDRRAGEWVTWPVFLQRVRAGQTDRIAEQVPITPTTTQSGFQVLAERQEAVRRHWEHVFQLRETYGLR